MKRITVHGSPGAGKSTLAKRLHDLSGLPVIHLDQIYRRDDWQLKNADEARQLLKNEIAKECWIIEGIYSSSYPLRTNSADTIIFIDIPRLQLIWRVIRRVLKNRGIVQSDMPQGCPEKFDWSFMKEIWNSTKKGQIKDKIQQAINDAPASAKVIRLTSDHEIELYFQSVTKNQATLLNS